jgi:hypothetical protein
MNMFKSKSLVSHISDEKVGQNGGAMRFISFESAIQLFRERYNLMELKDKPLGYRVTEQGIEILFD